MRVPDRDFTRKWKFWLSFLPAGFSVRLLTFPFQEDVSLGIMAINPAYLMTLPQLISAKKKLGTVAGSYDPQESSIIRDLFVSEELSPSELRYVLYLLCPLGQQ